MKKESFDALFVISQDVDLDKVIHIVIKNKYTSIFVLSTHFLFSNEVSTLTTSLGNTQIEIKSFGDFLLEKEMDEIDEKAYKAYTKISKVHPDANHIFLENITYLKNRAIHQKLLTQYSFGKIYYWATRWVRVNLGISHRYWSGQNAYNQIPLNYYWKKRASRFLQKSSMVQYLKLAVFYVKTITEKRSTWLISNDGQHYIFHSLRRLKLEDQTKIIKKEYRGIQFFSWTKSNSLVQTLDRFLKSLELEGEIFLSTPLHQFSQLAHLTGNPIRPVLIFVDGYRPSNYSPFYYVNYFPYGNFVSRDMFDDELKTKSGRISIKPFSFLKKNYFEIQENNVQLNPQRITLSINHAGDWSSLVDRTDTDKLIFSFVKLSKKLKQISFVIRLHPTMNKAEYEGKNAKSRIRKFVNELNYNNLSVSDVTLEEDWQRSDIFVSEYSLSALDAMRYGKICLFVNLTRRRSFVQDYVDLGFPLATSEADFFEKIEEIIALPNEYQKRQIAAAKRYNEKLNMYLNS